MGSKDFAQIQKTAPKRHTKLDDEELLSLLGQSQRRSNEAVPIAKPGNRRNPYKPSNSSVRPMNTLTTSSQLPDQIYSARPPTSKVKQHMLSVDVSRGYNVADPRGPEIEDSFEAPHSAKRQKLIHPGSETLESSDSTIDDLPPDQVKFGRNSRENAALRRKQSGTLDKMQQNIDALDEYRSVEGMMDSKPRNAKRSKAAITQKPPSPLMMSLSRNDSVEILGEGEHIARPAAVPSELRNVGTLRKQPASPQTNAIKDSSQIQRTKEAYSQYFKPRLPDRPTEDDRSLRATFVATDGRLRGTDYLSSDELDGPATIGEHADVVPLSPRKRHTSQSAQSPSMKAAEPSPPEVPLERSNIKPTVFRTQPPGKGLGRPETFEDEYLHESEPSWAIPVAAVNLPGQKQMHKSANMAIIYDEENKRYFIKDGGRALKASNGSALGFYPKSLQKCSREEFGKKIRFESSKRGTEDHVLDLELMTQNDANDLILRIERDSTNVKAITLDSKRMEKMFENRRNQHRPPISPAEGLENMPEDVQMIARNQERQRLKERQTRVTTDTRRRSSKVTDNMTENSTSEDLTAYFRGASATTTTGPSSRTTTMANSSATSRPGIFERVRPAHNDHLRRSTRTSGVPTRFLEDLEEPEQLKVEKYSAKYGLGDKWSKPLSYPKMGKKKATVEWEDLERLDEGEFLNDNLVSFYMRYLEEELANKDPDLAKTVYFFNSFFYDRLTTNQKGQKGINYEGVQRWTRGVNLFTYDFVVVPINELTHWYVAIICNLPALDQSLDMTEESPSPLDGSNIQVSGKLQDPVAKQNGSEPRENEARKSFAEMSLDNMPIKRRESEDSLLGKVDTVKVEDDGARNEEDEEMLDAPNMADRESEPANAQQVEDDATVDVDDVPKPVTLTKKQKRKSILPSITKFDPCEPSIITFDSFGHPHSQVIRVLKQYISEEGKSKRNIEFDVGHIKGITAKNIPQQSNFSDCGLFMLGYVEKFLGDGPRDFIARIIRREYDDHKDWPKMVPSTMRSDLREHLQRLHDEDQDERRAAAIKAGKYVPWPRAENAASPTVRERSTFDGEAASKNLLKFNAEEPVENQGADIQPVDVQKIRNARYLPAAMTEEQRTNHVAKPEQSNDAAHSIHDTFTNPSPIVIESQTQPEVATKEEQPDVPSSQPPKPPTPGHNISGSFPTLPSEIEDSQPSQQLPVAKLNAPTLLEMSKPRGKDHPCEDQTAAHDPSSSQHQIVKDQKVSDESVQQASPNVLHKHLHKGDSVSAPPLSKRRRGRGVAQSVPQLTQQGKKKMTKEEAIVLDDD